MDAPLRRDRQIDGAVRIPEAPVATSVASAGRDRPRRGRVDHVHNRGNWPLTRADIQQPVEVLFAARVCLGNLAGGAIERTIGIGNNLLATGIGQFVNSFRR